MGEQNGMDRQPPEERIRDLGRYAKARMKKKITGKISLKVKVILGIILILLLILMALFFTFSVFDLQKKHAKGMAETIYEELGVEDLTEFIVIKGNDSTGHYYDFVDGADEKLDELVKILKRDYSKAITKDLLKKMIKAEVVNQFPLLSGGTSGGSASSYSGNDIAEKVWNFLVGQGYSEVAVAGLMGNIHQESDGFNPALVENGGSGEGIGLIQWSFGRRTQLENYAASLGKDWTDVDVQLDFLLMELTPGGSEYADFQFIPASACEQWKNASTPEEAARIFSDAFERPGTPLMENRIHWANVYYEQFRGTFNPEEDTDSGAVSVQEFLDEAQKVADYVRENEFNYGDAPINPAINNDAKLVSCDRFVGWVLYNIGFTDQPETQGLTVHVLRDYCQDKGWEEITDVNQLQAGDIVFTNNNGDPYGHTFICASERSADGTYTRYDCGSQTRIRSQQPFYEPINGFTTAFRPNLSETSTKLGEFQGTIRIRRVTPNKNIGEVKNTGGGATVSVDTEGLGYKQEIPENIRQQMEGVSMQHLSGITYDELSYLTIPYYDFNGNVQQGHMIVHEKLADEVLLIFQELYKIKYPIERMELIDNFTGSNNLTGADLDYASIDANNTSAFNDRVTVDPSGTGTQPSLHATGQAIDINPQINPYINADGTSAHSNAQKYNTNRDTKPGWTEVEKAACITKDSEIYKIFTEYGWKWLGNDNNTGDTQHFYKDDLTNVKTIATDTQVTDNIGGSGSSSEIENYINNNAASGIWSVYAKNLTTNSVKVSLNNRKLESASLIKLFIMATAYEEIEKGTLNKSEVIDDIRIMINRSDNDAANRMIDRLGFDKINNYINTHSYSSTQINRKMLEGTENGDNYTSVVDVGNLLESMYRGTCVSQSASQEMIEILKTQTLTSKIPAGVPSGVETANKTGELSDVENDAAIVYKDGAHYVVVIMSNNLNDTAKARNNIKDISSKIYNSIDSTSSSQGGTNANATHKVAIVAGHGLSRNAGSYEEVANRTKWYTTGTSGTTPSGETWREYQITKKVADYVEQYLAPYSSDVSVVQVGYSQPNWERMQLAKDQGVDAYVGIHFNSSENTNASGVSAYYRNGDSTSQSFANIFANTVSEYMGLKNNGVMDDSTSNNGQLDSIGNSSEWGFPSTLIEGGFMSNSSDMEVIGADNEEGLKKYAQGIAAGILQYYGIENRGLDGVSMVSSVTTTTSGVNSKIYDLKYVSPEKFQEYVDSNNRQALNTYTLDPETKKLIVANWSYTTENGLEIKQCNPINFRSVLNKYTMPIEYMIDFLVHTDNAEMVSKLADLALDSEYVIAIQDNVTTVQTTVDIQEKTYRRTSVGDGYYINDFTDWHTVSTDIKVKETVSNEIELTYADSWFVKFFKTTSYSTMSFNQSAGNNLTAEQGDYIGEFKTTVYCAGCNTPAGSTETASGIPATANHTIAVHTEYFNGQAVGGKLAKGSQVVINGQVYTVEDTGDLSRRQIDNWIDIYTETPCENYLSLDSGTGTVSVYVANNVREATSEDAGTEERDIEDENRRLKGLNTVSTVPGKVTDTTTVMEETLPTTYERAGRNESYRVTEKKKITTVRTISNKYDSGKEEIEPNEQKVIDVLLSFEGLIDRFNMGWMEGILAQDEKTVNMIDLTKYLYNKAKEQKNNIQSSDEKYSFDVYKYNDLYNIYGSAGILEEFIKALENNPLRLYMSNHVSIDEGEIFDYITTEDEPSYKMLTNEYDGRGFGFNIFHRLNETDWNTGGTYEDRIVEHYDDLGVDIKSYVNMDQTLETSTVDQVMRKEIEKWRDIVEESIEKKGLELEDYQIDALTVIAYEYGWSDEYASNFANAYQNYYLADNKKAFRKNFELPMLEVKPFDVDTSGRDLTEEEEKQNLRNSLTWELFDTGKYKTPEGEILDPDSFHGGNGEFLNVAYEIWLQICKEFTAYGGSSIPAPGPQIDCSGYVSWVLYQYGVVTGNNDLVQEFQGWQHTTETLKTVDWERLGFEVIPVAAGEDVREILQPGDILDRSVGDGANGHTQIIVEVKDGVVYTYDCGAVSHWQGKNGEPYISNFAASDSRPGIIIRRK